MVTQRQIDVSPATDEHRAIATITMAFSNDPVTRWVLPDANQYLTFWPQFVKAFAGAAFEKSTVDSIDSYGGIAMWLSPGVASDEETMGALAAEAVPASDQDEVFAFMGQMGEFQAGSSPPMWPMLRKSR